MTQVAEKVMEMLQRRIEMIENQLVAAGLQKIVDDRASTAARHEARNQAQVDLIAADGRERSMQKQISAIDKTLNGSSARSENTWMKWGLAIQTSVILLLTGILLRVHL